MEPVGAYSRWTLSFLSKMTTEWKWTILKALKQSNENLNNLSQWKDFLRCENIDILTHPKKRERAYKRDLTLKKSLAS